MEHWLEREIAQWYTQKYFLLMVYMFWCDTYAYNFKKQQQQQQQQQQQNNNDYQKTKKKPIKLTDWNWS